MLPGATTHIQIKPWNSITALRFTQTDLLTDCRKKTHTLKEEAGEKCYTIKTSERA